jgi:hypothetical protein
VIRSESDLSQRTAHSEGIEEWSGLADSDVDEFPDQRCNDVGRLLRRRFTACENESRNTGGAQGFDFAPAAADRLVA